MDQSRSSPGGFSSSRTKFLVALGVFTFLGLLVYHRALSLGFFADDTWVFFNYQTSWLVPNPESPHYPPLYFAVWYTLYRLFHLNPLPYHLFSVLVACLNAALLKSLASELEFKPWQCWTAGLLVLFNSVAAEAYFWFCIVNTLMMVTLVLLALLCLLRFRVNRAWGWGVAYLVLVFLAASFDGKGMVLPLLGLLLVWGWKEGNLRRPQGGLAIHFFSFGVIGGLVLMRSLLGIRSATIHLPLREKWHTLTATLTTTLFHGLDNHLWVWLKDWPKVWHYVPGALEIALVALLIWGWLRSRGLARRRLVTLVLLWIVSCLPHVMVANLQFRYYYFPGIFAALIIMTLLELLRGRLANGKGYLRVGLVVLVILVLDLRGLHLALNSFQKASSIYEAGIQTIKKKVPVMAPGTHVLLIDFPMFIYSQQNAGVPRPRLIPYVYVFPQSMPYHLRLLYKQDDITTTFVKLASDSPDNPRPLGKKMTLSQVRALLKRPHTLAFRYRPEKVPHFVQIKRK